MESTTARHSRTRKILVWVLVVLSTLITFGSAAEVWVKHQLLDTPAWVRASDKLLATPEVRSALAAYIVSQQPLDDHGRASIVNHKLCNH